MSLLCASPLFALLVGHVAVPRSGSRELGAAIGARGFGGGAGLLALVAEKVAEGGELAAVAAVLPALRLGARLHDTHAVGVVRHLGAGMPVEGVHALHVGHVV